MLIWNSFILPPIEIKFMLRYPADSSKHCPVHLTSFYPFLDPRKPFESAGSSTQRAHTV
jgi:hypothetical protein